MNTNWFLSLEDARGGIDAWREDYNESRPHMSLGYLTPLEFASVPEEIPSSALQNEAVDSPCAWT